MIKCKAAIGNGEGGFSVEEIMVGNPVGDEVLVRVKAAGVCHTDWDSQSWGKQVVMGHEGSGEVISVGPNVQDLAKGDSVILNWAVPCYQCFQCQEGNQHICEVNSAVTAGNSVSGGHATLASTKLKSQPIERSFSIGTMAEYTLVRRAACVKTTVEIPHGSAAIISCGVMTGYGSVVNSARLTAGSSAVVMGCGGVGLNAIQGARISGASMIIAIDINPERLEMAKLYGATHTLLASRDDVGLSAAAEQVKAMTDGRGADYAFECTAIPALGAAPLAIVRNAGTAVQVSGIEETIQVDMNLFEWDKVYINPLYGGARPQVDFPKLLSLYASGELLLDEMISREYALEDLGMAFDDMHNGRIAKGVITF